MSENIFAGKYRFYTANELKCSGWLERQLKLQAASLAGNLDKIWPDVKESQWIGGSCEGWERVPYWLDGFVPLAYLLQDQEMISRVKKYINAIVDSRQQDGWICPCSLEERETYDMWALILIGKVLTVYYDCSGDERIPSILREAFRNFACHIKKHPLFRWGKHRWYEALISLEFLYRMQPEEWIVELAKDLHDQGWDVDAQYSDWKYALPKREWQWETHVVNQAMALKAGALYSPFNGDDPERLPRLMLEILRRDHGMAHGHFTGDECLAGTSPSQGSELCGVVEAMYSEELLLAFTGNPDWGDWLEMLAFNAYPATTTPDMWGHQYDQQTNQIACAEQPEEHIVYTTNHPPANMFGLEPNYGCCTANMSQGWPKFALSTWMRSNRKDDVIFNALPLPSILNTRVNGSDVCLEIVTDYPFKNKISYLVRTEKDVEFELRLRIPGTAAAAQLDGKFVKPSSVAGIRKVWSAGVTEVTLTLEFRTVMEKRPNEMWVVRRGPLLYSLPIKASERTIEYTAKGVERKFPYCDYEYLPQEKWNYGFAAEDFTVEEHPVPGMPFDPLYPAVVLKGWFSEIDWQTLPGNPVCADHSPRERKALTPAEEKILIPYGCTTLRMTEMPKVLHP